MKAVLPSASRKAYSANADEPVDGPRAHQSMVPEADSEQNYGQIGYKKTRAMLETRCFCAF